MNIPFYNQLTPREKTAAKMLWWVFGANPWKIKIFQIVRGDSVEDFRELLKQLKSEGKDHPTMTTILGSSAYKAVMACEDAAPVLRCTS